MSDSWWRICGLHVEEDGTVGVVWLGHDRTTSVIHCYDCALLKSEPLAMISSCIGSRGRKIPLAWRKQDEPFAKKLELDGIDVLPDPCHDNQSWAEVITREIWQKLRTSQFVLEENFGELRNEYELFNWNDSQVPMQGFPLMAATRHAIEKLDWARGGSFGKSRTPCAPDLRPV